jgi:hypothetical protein
MDCIHLVQIQTPVKVSCDNGNEHLAFTKGGGFPDY